MSQPMQKCRRPSRGSARPARGCEISARGAIPRASDCLDHAALHVPDPRVVPVPGHADAHRVVRRPELDHVDPGHREDRVEVLDRLPLLDHERDHRAVERLHERRAAAVQHVARRPAACRRRGGRRARRLGPHGPHALADVLHRSHVGEQEVLDAGADRARGQVRPRVLLDLHHPGHVVEQVDRAAEVLEGEYRSYGVYSATNST